MTARAMRLAAVDLRRTIDSASQVLRVGHRLHVARVHAMSHSTHVVDLQPIGDRLHQELVDETVSRHHPLTVPELGIAVRVGRTLPLPAPIAQHSLIQEPLEHRRRHTRTLHPHLARDEGPPACWWPLVGSERDRYDFGFGLSLSSPPSASSPARAISLESTMPSSFSSVAENEAVVGS